MKHETVRIYKIPSDFDPPVGDTINDGPVKSLKRIEAWIFTSVQDVNIEKTCYRFTTEQKETNLAICFS